MRSLFGPFSLLFLFFQFQFWYIGVFTFDEFSCPLPLGIDPPAHHAREQNANLGTHRVSGVCSFSSSFFPQVVVSRKQAGRQ